jgi:hypothetical protein
VTEPELKADKKRRRRFSAIVTTLSVLIGVSLYLGITNAIQQDSSTGRIGKLERPSGPELANRLKVGIEECLKRPSCLPVFAAGVKRAGRAQPTRRNGGATRTPSSHRHGGHTIPRQGDRNGGPNGGSNGGPNGGPTPAPSPPSSPSRPAPTPAPRPHVELPPPLPTVRLPTPHLPLPAACVPGPLHICVQP